MGRWLQESRSVLQERYDVALLDLDGVVYIGPEAVAGASEALARASDAGMRLTFVTNNASRTPDEVAQHLSRLGVRAAADDVVTSAQAAAALLALDHPPGARIFMIGGSGLEAALVEVGLCPVTDLDADPVAVVSGYHPDLPWRRVIDGAIGVRRGLPWTATNTDRTVPTPHGRGPGNGVLVSVVADFAEVAPRVAGKPEPPLFHETVRRVGAEHPLVVGDRLDTDIEGAVRAGYDSLLVLTGVTGLAELVAATPQERPTFLSCDLTGLTRTHPAPTSGDGGWVCGAWHVSRRDAALTVEGDGVPDDWWRAVAAAAWDHLDTSGSVADTSRLTPPGARS